MCPGSVAAGQQRRRLCGERGAPTAHLMTARHMLVMCLGVVQ